MEAVLFAGFMIGMMHAMEADHVAAVASLASRSRARGEAVRMGLAWGLGHTATLFCLGALVLSLNTVLAPRIASTLELLVGVMLVGLGIGVLHRASRTRKQGERLPFARRSGHAHSRGHLVQASDARDVQVHGQASGLPRHALAVGLLHGLAGSAALVVLALDNVGSIGLAIAYIGLFGIGSIAGMAMLSLAMAFPLQLAAKGPAWAYRGMSVAIGLATITLGCWTIYASAVEAGIVKV